MPNLCDERLDSTGSQRAIVMEVQFLDSYSSSQPLKSELGWKFREDHQEHHASYGAP